MKKVLFIIFFVSLVVTAFCQNNIDKQYPYGYPKLNDSTLLAELIPLILDEDDTNALQKWDTEFAKITAYYKEENDFFYDNEDVIKPLPPFNSIEYIEEDEENTDANYLKKIIQDLAPESGILKFYNYRFPDIGGLHVYYYGELDRYTSDIKGILMLYNPTDSILTILPSLEVKSETYFSVFRIDDKGISYYDGVSSFQEYPNAFLGKSQQISITENGEIFKSNCLESSLYKKFDAKKEADGTVDKTASVANYLGFDIQYAPCLSKEMKKKNKQVKACMTNKYGPDFWSYFDLYLAQSLQRK